MERIRVHLQGVFVEGHLFGSIPLLSSQLDVLRLVTENSRLALLVLHRQVARSRHMTRKGSAIRRATLKMEKSCSSISASTLKTEQNCRDITLQTF